MPDQYLEQAASLCSVLREVAKAKPGHLNLQFKTNQAYESLLLAEKTKDPQYARWSNTQYNALSWVIGCLTRLPLFSYQGMSRKKEMFLDKAICERIIGTIYSGRLIRNLEFKRNTGREMMEPQETHVDLIEAIEKGDYGDITDRSDSLFRGNRTDKLAEALDFVRYEISPISPRLEIQQEPAQPLTFQFDQAYEALKISVETKDDSDITWVRELYSALNKILKKTINKDFLYTRIEEEDPFNSFKLQYAIAKEIPDFLGYIFMVGDLPEKETDIDLLRIINKKGVKYSTIPAQVIKLLGRRHLDKVMDVFESIRESSQ